jgi:hypothetical protein
VPTSFSCSPPDSLLSPNRVWNFHIILLWLTLPRDYFVFRFLNLQQQVSSAVRQPVLRFGDVIFFWSFGIIDTCTIKCWELSTAQAGSRGREGCCTYSLSLMYRLNQTESAIFMLFCCDLYFRGIFFFRFCSPIILRYSKIQCFFLRRPYWYRKGEISYYEWHPGIQCLTERSIFLVSRVPKPDRPFKGEKL